ncbi:hypothetical protein, partial [uncultured Clostridium sp.]|uniref:hypothetical protein n=1 Tax=uncultured Clostridium sp. TaxID=59620 RepID=UPI00272DE0F9
MIQNGYISDVWENWVNGNWDNGPNLKQLEELYNRCSDDSRIDYFDEYLDWRIQYEFEQKLKDNKINV